MEKLKTYFYYCIILLAVVAVLSLTNIILNIGYKVIMITIIVVTVYILYQKDKAKQKKKPSYDDFDDYIPF